MMRYSIFAALLTLAGRASAVSFINPPPPSGTTGDFGANPVYTEGTAIQIAWTDTQDNGIPFSVVVYQVDISSGTDIPSNQAFEYVVHNSVNLTSSPWVVATAKNLTFSNVFVLAMFFQGDTAGRALSHWFNISRSTNEAQRPTQTATLTTTSITPTVSSSITAVSTPAAANDDSFSTGAKVGLAVGIVSVLGLGVAVGWFWSRWNRRRREQQPEPAMEGSYAGGGSEKGLSPPVFHEVGGKAPPRELHTETQRYELGGTYP